MSSSISKLLVDEEQFYNALVQKLQESNTWVDLLPTGVGSTIMTMVSGATSVNQHYILLLFREAFLRTANRDSSIYEGASSLGVQIVRKGCSATTAKLTNSALNTEFIPPYSTFDIEGDAFFNVDQLTLPPSIELNNIKLYQGTVVEKTFNVADYTEESGMVRLEFGESNFNVANDHITVWETDEDGSVQVYTKSEDSLLVTESDATVYFEFTTGKGDVSILFGNNTYGRAPSKNSTISVRYVTTKGAEVVGISGSAIRYLSNSNVKGNNTSAIVGGSNEQPASYYKAFAPYLFRSKGKAISRPEVRAVVSTYPGVADSAIFYQSDIAPYDPAWRSVMRVCILPRNSDTLGGANPDPSSAAWQQFRDWLQNKIHHMGMIQTWNPEKIYVKISLTLAVYKWADPSVIKVQAMERVLSLFVRRNGILGRKLSLSDLENACRVEGVDYVSVISPETSITPKDRTQYIVVDGTPEIKVVFTEREEQ